MTGKQTLSHLFKKEFEKWPFDFSINPYLGFYYAEDRLYIIHDGMTGAFWFIEAGSPKEAIYKVLKKCEEADGAGERVPEWID